MTTAPPERSVPKPVFTDAETASTELPDSNARRFNYYTRRSGSRPTTRT